MAEIDLTFIELLNEEEETKEPEVVIDKKKIEPRFTEGVKEFYINLGKNMPNDEKEAMLEEIEIDYLFNELRRRFEGLSRVIEGVTAVVLDTDPVDVNPERIEALRADFKRAEKLKDRLKEIINA